MGFEVKKAKREKICVKVALMAPSGGGKTYGALRLATGMANEIEKETGKKAKILMGNTEQKRGYYYANEFDYDIVDVEAPHNPEKYVELINFAVEQGYDILIIDSTSHEWEGKGGCLDLQTQAGGTYQAWSKITPRHNKFIEALAESPIHIIATMRGKDQYEATKDEKTGKMSVQKLGVGAKQRDGFEYEFTCTFLIDQKTNTAEVQKDNTHIFEGQGATLLTEKHGEQIIKWANSGEEPEKKPVPKKAVSNKEVVNDNSDLAKVRKDIIAVAKELGGSKNPDVKKLCEDEIGTINPNNVDDLDKLHSLLTKLQDLKNKEGDK